MKVLLIQPPHAGREPSLFPLGLGYIAAALKEIGCEVEVFDIHAHNYSRKETTQKLEKLGYDLVGINAFSTQYSYIKWLTAELKKYHQGKIILGGPLPTYNPSLVLEKTDADICVISEGDATIKEIVENINNLERVRGIYFSQDGEIIATPSREYLKDVNGIPLPPYDIFPMDIYFKHISLFGAPARKTMNLITARGCPYRCNFCSRTITGARFRTIDNVIEEIKTLKKRYAIDSVLFNDELVVVSRKRVRELCDKIRDLNIIWGCQGRANTIELDLLKYMKKAGCVYVGYGIESGSQKILDNMNKGVTVAQNEKAIRETLKTGLTPVIQMMFGYPGEDEGTIKETVDLLKRIHCSVPLPNSPEPQLSLTTPLPGSPLYDQVLKEGLIKDEDEYLSKIELGYSRGSPVIINFTKFTNEELFALKEKAEREIYANYKGYLRRHPWKYVPNYWRDLKRYRYRYGYRAAFKVVISKVFRRAAKVSISPAGATAGKTRFRLS